MNTARIVGIVLIVAGALGLVYGGFSYTKETTKATLGPFELRVQEQETVNVPLVLSGAAVVLGVLLVVFRRDK